MPKHNLGNGTFVYEGAQSPVNIAFSVWRMAWHNGIRLHGHGAPPDGVSVFWSVTRPTLEALAQESGAVIEASADKSTAQGSKPVEVGEAKK